MFSNSKHEIVLFDWYVKVIDAFPFVSFYCTKLRNSTNMLVPLVQEQDNNTDAGTFTARTCIHITNTSLFLVDAVSLAIFPLL